MLYKLLVICRLLGFLELKKVVKEKRRLADVKRSDEYVTCVHVSNAEYSSTEGIWNQFPFLSLVNTYVFYSLHKTDFPSNDSWY